MDSSERGMNPVATIIINPRKVYWPSRSDRKKKSLRGRERERERERGEKE